MEYSFVKTMVRPLYGFQLTIKEKQLNVKCKEILFIGVTHPVYIFRANPVREI